MDEITKLYKNAGIVPKRKCEFDDDCPYGFSHSCDNCDIELTEFNVSYPPFTAEKQIELIIFIVNKFGSLIFHDYVKFTREVMARKIAKFLNGRWRDLSDILKQQIKEILE